MNQFTSPDMFFFIAGPCALESENHVLFMAETLKALTDRLGLKFCFKVSWDTANRPSAGSPVNIQTPSGSVAQTFFTGTCSVPRPVARFGK